MSYRPKEIQIEARCLTKRSFQFHLLRETSNSFPFSSNRERRRYSDSSPSRGKRRATSRRAVQEMGSRPRMDLVVGHCRSDSSVSPCGISNRTREATGPSQQLVKSDSGHQSDPKSSYCTNERFADRARL